MKETGKMENWGRGGAGEAGEGVRCLRSMKGGEEERKKLGGGGGSLESLVLVRFEVLSCVHRGWR